MARYLVTGGAGFIGSHLVEELLRRGDTVRVLDNLSTGKRANLDAAAAAAGAAVPEFIEGDVADCDVARRAVEGIEYVPTMPTSTAPSRSSSPLVTRA